MPTHFNHPPAENTPHGQTGYSLIELTIVLILVAGLVIGLFAIYQFKMAADKAEAIAGQYQRINLAVSGYLSQNSDALLQLLDKAPGCSNIPWRASSAGVAGVSVTPDPTGCELKNSAGATLAVNGVQPTLDELRNLQFLDQTTASNLALSTTPTVVGNIGGANQFLPARFAIQISRVCVQHAGPVSTSSHLNCSVSGTPGYWDLSSLVFNSQPFSDSAIYTGRGFNLLHMIFNAAGPDALMATQGLQRVTNASGVDITNQFP